MKHPIIMDVDTGIDDAMAIMVAALHPDVELKAISCVSGNVSVDKVLANTLKVLDLVGAPEIPVAAGATRPLVEERRDASQVHGASGLGDLELPESARRPAEVHAVELLRREILASAEPVTLVALAPMTNLALLLRTHPEVTENLGRIVFMGGSATVGNATAVAEFNVWHDPEAAHIVLSSGVPLTMYGLDVFNEVAASDRAVRALRASENSLARALADLLGFEIPGPDGSSHAYNLIGDAGAVCAIVAPELFTIEPWPVRVELAPSLSRGQTLVDRRARPGEDAIHDPSRTPWPVADVVLAERRPGSVIELFLRTLDVEDVLTNVPSAS
ncbi:nucleoside hydrolase [Sinomonas sp. ASV322]|uniref:nucleoside hydrolase n=1 Tax=Sinomonas sp. ASV322 TaxID=3041920 RepID=UPI0027DDBA94|nr:nucleoside hydrolase [Sinomonas sp. ASV322]MDQ4504401.1 nucleoside hydrolase [Sinomonas sp. ASV322]